MHRVCSEIVEELLVASEADGTDTASTVVLSVAPRRSGRCPTVPAPKPVTESREPREDADGDLELPRNRRRQRRHNDAPSPRNDDESIEIETTRSGSADATGMQLWRAAFLLAEFLHLRAADVDGSTVIEVGAGVGFVSLVTARMAARVFATDGDTEALAVCERNVERNAWACDRVRVCYLQWLSTNSESEPDVAIPERFLCSPSDHAEMNKKVEWIIASDVFYDDDVADAFLDTLHRLMQDHPRATVIVAAEKRVVFSAFTLSEISLGYDAFEERQCRHKPTTAASNGCVTSCHACSSSDETKPRFIATPISIDSIPHCYDYDRVSTLGIWQLHAVVDKVSIRYPQM